MRSNAAETQRCRLENFARHEQGQWDYQLLCEGFSLLQMPEPAA